MQYASFFSVLFPSPNIRSVLFASFEPSFFALRLLHLLHKSASAQVVVIVVVIGMLSLLLSILLRPLVIFATAAGFSYMHFLRARDLDKFRLIPRSDPPFSH